jgi:hypothetical protein
MAERASEVLEQIRRSEDVAELGEDPSWSLGTGPRTRAREILFAD